MPNSVFSYFKRSVAFFDLKAKAVSPAVFVATLGLNAAYLYLLQADNASLLLYLLQDPNAAPPSALTVAMSFAIPILLNVISDIYLAAAIFEARDLEYSAADCVRLVLKKAFRLVAVSLLKSMIISAGLFLFIVPGIVLMVVLIFAECCVLDRGLGVLPSLMHSHSMTNGRKGELFKIELFCNLIIAFFAILLLTFFSAINPFVFQYISLFVITVCLLIERKLVALLYADVLVAHREAKVKAGTDAGSLLFPPKKSDNRSDDDGPDSDARGQ